MPLDANQFEEGIHKYWAAIASRSLDVQERERSFPELATTFADRQPPHFTRADLERIITWKYTDARRRDKALEGLAKLPDQHLRDITAVIQDARSATDVSWKLTGAIHGVGIAGVSAILAAAKPDRFPVIDVFALIAISHYYSPEWIASVPRDATGKLQADQKSYGPYTTFCRERAKELFVVSGHAWTPRRMDMALWAIGKGLDDADCARE